jgi:transcriptional regulator GlxA family with amidase domain
MSKMAFSIVIPVYEKVNLLDVAAPLEMFGWWASYDRVRDIQIFLAAEARGVVNTYSPAVANGAGLKIIADLAFSDVRRADLLWVPGGSVGALQEQMKNPVYLDFLKRVSRDAEYVTSVCEGAMLLAEAGLLDGFRATTHWAFIKCLAKFKRIEVVPDPNLPDPKFPRFVVDDHDGTLSKGIRVTGGGISSGLDESLEIIRRIAGVTIAQRVQSTTQYFPSPPVQGPEPSLVNCPMSP